jgi:hypothetical protein
MRISGMLLKKGIAAGLTLYQIASIITRSNLDQPSQLEIICYQATEIARSVRSNVRRFIKPNYKVPVSSPACTNNITPKIEPSLFTLGSLKLKNVVEEEEEEKETVSSVKMTNNYMNECTLTYNIDTKISTPTISLLSSSPPNNSMNAIDPPTLTLLRRSISYHDFGNKNLHTNSTFGANFITDQYSKSKSTFKNVIHQPFKNDTLSEVEQNELWFQSLNSLLDTLIARINGDVDGLFRSPDISSQPSPSQSPAFTSLSPPNGQLPSLDLSPHTSPTYHSKFFASGNTPSPSPSISPVTHPVSPPSPYQL